uniref:Uncharacterized protein n=1 Tax=viral metagenome TaxID=1070528 RepID=A0A6C0AQZ4_9ZZZZ
MSIVATTLQTIYENEVIKAPVRPGQLLVIVTRDANDRVHVTLPVSIEQDLFGTATCTYEPERAYYNYDVTGERRDNAFTAEELGLEESVLTTLLNLLYLLVEIDADYDGDSGIRAMYEHQLNTVREAAIKWLD